jgi:hypothetical protein
MKAQHPLEKPHLLEQFVEVQVITFNRLQAMYVFDNKTLRVLSV